jgi:hypothetical protein
MKTILCQTLLAPNQCPSPQKEIVNKNIKKEKSSKQKTKEATCSKKINKKLLKNRR